MESCPVGIVLTRISIARQNIIPDLTLTLLRVVHAQKASRQNGA